MQSKYLKHVKTRMLILIDNRVCQRKGKERCALVIRDSVG